MTEEAHDFRQRAEAKAGDERHRRMLLKVIGNYDVQVDAMKQSQFEDWQAARRLARDVKDQALDELPELLEQFETKAQARGTQVRWARDTEEARRIIGEVVERLDAKRVVKSKSMTTEEIELNELLEERGVEVVESDLGELIVQLAHEKPYHIVTPAMHKTRGEISELFQKELGSAPTTDPEALTLVARDHLRDIYTTADIGITGANFIVADDGAIAITENEGNARLSTSCPKVHVAIVGIEKVVPRLSQLALFWPLLATSGTGQHITCYSSVIRGPRQEGERGGPDEMIVILLDNGRSRIYADEKLRQSLRCIRCGACLNACPVFRTVGGHAYNTPYSGPIGSAITPHLRPLDTWQHLPFASSLCGACSDVCPVSIDIHHLLLENRLRAAEAGVTSGSWKWLLRVWAWVMRARWRVAWFRWWGRWVARVVPSLVPESQRPVARSLPARSFAAEWKHGARARSTRANTSPKGERAP